MISSLVSVLVLAPFTMLVPVLSSPLPVDTLAVMSTSGDELISLEKRIFGRQSCCVAKNKKNTVSSWQEKFECINLIPLGNKHFFSRLEDVFDDVKNFGDDVAYNSMRDKLNMIFENLKLLETQLGDPGTMKRLSQAERVELLTSTSCAYAKCKKHFRAFQEAEWQWYLRKIHANHKIIRDQYLKVFQSHFDLVGITLGYCLQKYQVPVDNWDLVSRPVACDN